MFCLFAILLLMTQRWNIHETLASEHSVLESQFFIFW